MSLNRAYFSVVCWREISFLKHLKFMPIHNTRPYCAICHYPTSTCLCSAIDEVLVPVDIVILQHPKEKDHAKNTARLVALCMPNATIISTTDEKAINTLRENCLPTNSALIYPNDVSEPLEGGLATPIQSLHTLVFIDGSWKQAYGVIQQNNWLKTLPSYHFKHAPQSNYAIRHTTINNALSTLEAVAYTLSNVLGTDVSALYNAQNALQQQWQGPLSHRRKY